MQFGAEALKRSKSLLCKITRKKKNAYIVKPQMRNWKIPGKIVKNRLSVFGYDVQCRLTTVMFPDMMSVQMNYNFYFCRYTPSIFTIAKLSIRNPGSSSVLII